MEGRLVNAFGRALLNDPAVLERDELVTGCENVGEPMGDEDEGGVASPACDALEQFDDLLVGKGAGRLVKQDDRVDRVNAAERKGLGDLDKLPLSKRERSGHRSRVDVDMQVVQHSFGLFDHGALP